MTNKLLAYLTENGIGHNFFARKVGSSPAAMSRYLRKGSIPSLEMAIAIEEKTKGAVTPYDWFSHTNDKIQPQKKKNKKKKNTKTKKPEI